MIRRNQDGDVVRDSKMLSEFKLNDAQRQAVMHRDGPLLVVAGPGSGKTRVVTARAAVLIESGVNPAGITVVTFTNTAAREMQLRLLRLLQNAGQRAGAVKIGTFHALFWKTLRRFGFADQLVDDNLKRRWITEALRKLGEEVRGDLIDELQRSVSWHKNNLQSAKDVSPEKKLLREVWLHYEEVKGAAGRIDFDDMLCQTYALLRDNPEALRHMQGHAHYLLVDEFQDTNRAQFEVLRMIAAAHGNICAVGDVDQAIYAWRAAKPEYLLNFGSYFPGTKRIELTANYRSTSAIVGYTSRVIERNSLRYAVVGRAARQGGEPPISISPSSQQAEASSIVTMVKKQSQIGTALEDMAVFYRINRYNHHLVGKLVEADTPFVVRDKERFLEEHWVMREVLAFFELTINPSQVEAFLLVARRQLNLSSEQSAQLQRLSQVDGVWQRAASLVSPERVAKLKLQVGAAGRLAPAAALDYYLEEMGFRRYLQNYATHRGLSRGEYSDICEELRLEMDSFSSVPAYVQRAKKRAQVLVQARSEDAVPGKLNLMTLHSAKGLEFEAVWIIGAVEGLLPHSLAEHPEQLEEERRLFYVGCTRAKNRLCISSPKKIHGRPVARSRFVTEGLTHVPKTSVPKADCSALRLI